MDTTFQQNADGADGENYSQGGRVQLNASATHTVGDATLAGKGTVNLGTDGSNDSNPGIDDA